MKTSLLSHYKPPMSKKLSPLDLVRLKLTCSLPAILIIIIINTKCCHSRDFQFQSLWLTLERTCTTLMLRPHGQLSTRPRIAQQF